MSMVALQPTVVITMPDVCCGMLFCMVWCEREIGSQSTAEGRAEGRAEGGWGCVVRGGAD